MAWLWARVHTRANSRQAGDFGEKLGYFSRGFHLFTQALVKEISSRGGTIITDVAVETIKRNPKNNVIEVETPKKKYSFDKVVATVPTHVFSKLIEGNPEVTPKYLKQLDSIDYLGAALLIFSSKQSLSKYYWHNINDLAAPFLVFIQHTNLIPAQRYNNYNIYYVGAYIPHKHIYFDMHEQDLKNVWYDYLREMFPDFDRAEIKDEHMFRLRNAQHIVDTNYESKIPAYTSPVAGVYLSNFSQIFPEDRGTNYAVREGKKLAAMLIEKENANS
jgi:protoporphyrinogen oxidase